MKKILIAMLASCPLLLQADQLINDDKIVIGNSCIGQDCINGENFSQMGVLKLKENNLRIHFFPDIDFSGVGKEWLIEANDSRNGGLNYFTFQSVDPDSEVAKLSDGYDSEIICDKWVNSYYTGNLIPVGDPVYEVVSQEARIGNLSVCQVSDTEVSDGSAQKPVCGEVFENGNYTGLYDGVIPQGEPVVIIASFEQGIWQKFTCQQAMTVKVEDRIFLPINDMQSIGLTGSKKDQPFTVAAGSENVLLQLKNIQQSILNVDLITVIELEQWKSSVHGKLDDVEQLLDARDLIYNYLIDSQQKSPELKDYQLIGIDDLTEEMINFINQRLAESELDPTKDKLVDIRAEVASARQAYLDSKNSGGGALGWLMMSLLFLFRIRYFRVS